MVAPTETMQPMFLRTHLIHDECLKSPETCVVPCSKCRDFRRDLETKIASLSGSLLKSDFDSRASFVLANEIVQSDKLILALAAGLWIVHPTYITDSFAAGKWLMPDKYEWGMEIASKIIPDTRDITKELLQACREQRLSKEAKVVAAKARGEVTSGLLFEGWNVFFMISEPERLQRYTSVLRAGGAQFVVEGDASAAITHVVVDMLGQTLPAHIPKTASVIAGISIMRSVVAGEEIAAKTIRSSEEFEVKTRMMEEIVNDHIENLLDPDSCESLVRSVRIFCQTGRLPKARTVEFIVKNVLPTQSELVVQCVSVLENLKSLHPPQRVPNAWVPGREFAEECLSDQSNEMDLLSGKRSYTSMAATRRSSNSLGIDGEEKGPSDWIFIKMAAEYSLAQDHALGWTEKIFGENRSGKNKWVQTLTGDGCLASIEYMVSVLEACAAVTDTDESIVTSGPKGNVGLAASMLREANETAEAALRDVLEWIRLCLSMDPKPDDDCDNKPDPDEGGKSTSYKPPVDSRGFPITTRLDSRQQQVLLIRLQSIASLIVNSSSAGAAPSQVTLLKKCYTSLDTTQRKAKLLDTVACDSVRIAAWKKDVIAMLLNTDYDKQSVPQDIVCLCGTNAKSSLFQIVGCYFFLRPKRTSSGSFDTRVFTDGKVDSMDNNSKVAVAWMNRNMRRLQVLETQENADWTESSEELLTLLLHYSSAYMYIKGRAIAGHTPAKALDDAPLQATMKLDECVASLRSRMPRSTRIDALCRALSFTLQFG
ncbi:hypothetical protein SARC_03769 [Sphaeroforma arctica JP610]|uniref:BRCT domain-containing protein n=1 Tax=Sphaeroforma arctica JP610 TaxID=667725 RepID=A0A0L0G705_9EUKA|nr:hypothetical protein SARC_03769 [Sphaeroforma arctica JP610]KNC84008.1 hypothetical protein SARC_03769 [Sphaeroforma arctica JP610]|eukprot:XP_014157910.1 hypothetical protein SARC_03769 [Sphaeroforma arctica JP610]